MQITDTELEMLNLLERLVNIDSGSYDADGVNKIGNILITLYESIGFMHTRFTNNAFNNTRLGDHLCLTHQDAYRPNILILAHLDTVFPKGESVDRPFKISGNRAYGPGVIDMKASHVQVYFTLKHLVQTRHPAYKNIEILLNSDEEIGSPTSQQLIRTKTHDKNFALVMEPARPNGNLVSARRGVGKYTIESFGVAAHAGISPKEGANAITELCHHISNIDKLSDHDGGISLNIGLIEGGKSVNTIPDYAKTTIDLRVLTQEQANFIDSAIKNLVSTTINPRCMLKITGGLNRPPMVKTPSSENLIDIIKYQASLLNITLEDIATGGGSDASFCSDEGIATIDGLGPVGGKQHTVDEYLDIDSLVPRTTLLIEIIKSLSSQCNGFN